ncbi:MAG: cellulase family glycosylhydrolase [Ruminococcus sp.]|nr:cellulase family glycosylhydrolase [Ruminococcus sp.]
MIKKLTALLAAAAMAVSLAGCSSDSNSESTSESSSSSTAESSDTEATAETEPETEEPTPEPTTVHVSPTEAISSTLGSQVTLSQTIMREDGSNTVSIPLSSFIEDGDTVSSFTFIIYSDGGNIGTFKGGCGISVTDSCSAATDEGWYQSEDFSSATEGTYGEITWNVPSEVSSCIDAGGEVLFGYWWGSVTSIRVEEVICTYTRTKEISCDGTVSFDVGQSVGYNDADNTVKFSYADAVPEGCAPTAIVYNISSGGLLGKFTGAFGISADNSDGWYQSGDIAVFTDSSSLSLTWIIPDSVSDKVTIGGEAMLGYWWSDQAAVTLDSVSIKYAYKNGSAASVSDDDSDSDSQAQITDTSSDSGDFRSADEIVSAIKVGWVLGNSLECYDYSDWTDDAETAWGNPKTTQAMIDAVKSAGSNAIRIPVTWGEHMNGDTIDSEWMDRVQEVVDYAYNSGMFVILNMHHDDYIWFTPSESEYEADSAKLCRIWEQICARFGDYGDRLLFEGMNEPRTVGSSAEWTGGTAEERAVINMYEQDFVDTVRGTGGNNAYRTLIVTSYAASIEDAAINDMVVPDDDNIIVSIHYYAPWEFANGKSNEWSKTELDAGFQKLKTKFIDNGIPVIIGEFGAVANNNDSTRKEFYEYYLSSAASYGLKCFIWDNNVESGESSFGLFDRETLTWNEEILQGIQNGMN